MSWINRLYRRLTWRVWDNMFDQDDDPYNDLWLLAVANEAWSELGRVVANDIDARTMRSLMGQPGEPDEPDFIFPTIADYHRACEMEQINGPATGEIAHRLRAALALPADWLGLHAVASEMAKNPKTFHVKQDGDDV